MPVFDRYLHQSSLVHRLDPRVKLLITLLFVLSNALLPEGVWLPFAFAWGLVLIAGILAKLPPLFLIKRAFIVLPFMLAAITVIFTMPGESLATFSLGSRQF